MAALSSFMSRVLVHVPHAPQPLVHQALRDAAREFCRRTLIWRDWVACVKSVSPVNEYTPTLPTDSAAVRLDMVTLDDKPVAVESYTCPAIDWQAAPEDLMQGAITDDLVVFTLLGAEVDGDVKARVTLMPTPSASTLPDLLATRYLETIAFGAASLVRSAQGSSATYDEAAAERLRGRFEAGLASATTDVFRAHRNERPRARVVWC